jgi:gas vesicle protein
MSRRHTPATRAIQRRLERLELDHLRQLAAEQGEQIEQLTADNERLQLYAQDSDRSAEFWQDQHHELAEHLNDGTADARCIGLTTGAMQ